MPEFTNPFGGVVPRQMTRSELVRAIRLNIAAEQEASFIYEAHADATDNALAREVLLDIAREERVHAGEFQKLLYILEPDEINAMAEGAEEVAEMAEHHGVSASVPPPPADAAEKRPVPTIGNLKD
ncbi:MAG: Rubrerythrin [Planctomycetes bacterium]|nr:Rubrerythrin [Planctomycetota bacterium]